MSFSFEIKKGVPMPEAAERSPAANAHSFPWGDLGDGDWFTVPADYWKDRMPDFAKYSQTKARERIRGNFKAWQDKDTKARSKVVLRVWNEKDNAVGVGIKITEPAATDTPNPLSTKAKAA